MTQAAVPTIRYVGESFVSHASGRPLLDVVADVRATARGVNAGSVRLVRCDTLPEDELCWWTFEAESERDVLTVTAAVGLELERVSRTVEVWSARVRPRRAGR